MPHEPDTHALLLAVSESLRENRSFLARFLYLAAHRRASIPFSAYKDRRARRVTRPWIVKGERGKKGKGKGKGRGKGWIALGARGRQRTDASARGRAKEVGSGRGEERGFEEI